MQVIIRHIQKLLDIFFNKTSEVYKDQPSAVPSPKAALLQLAVHQAGPIGLQMSCTVHSDIGLQIYAYNNLSNIRINDVYVFYDIDMICSTQ